MNTVEHKQRMIDRREAYSVMRGAPANINRHTDAPHENKREIARRLKAN